MKCEYCDNPVPSGVMRCPCCGGPVTQVHPASVNVAVNTAAIMSNVQTETNCARSAFPQHLGKNKWVYILLGVLLGEFRFHNFYTGYIARGIVKILITLIIWYVVLDLLDMGNS